VVVERDCKEIVLKPKQLVLATGMSAKPNMPKFDGMDIFKGDQHHSSQHPGPDKYKGKKAVVVGSNNSAHDICAALWEAGADVTMVQRSSTHIVRSDSLMELGLAALYSEQAVQSGMTTAKADLIFASLPYKILHEFQIPVYNAIRERDAVNRWLRLSWVSIPALRAHCRRCTERLDAFVLLQQLRTLLSRNALEPLAPPASS
jgi:putative flavoprotein involved in K+ transport